MDTYQEFNLPDEKAIRNKPVTIDLNDEYLFKHEYKKNLSAVFPIIRKKIYLSLCGKLVSGLKINSFQFSKKLSLSELIKMYLKYFFFLTKIRKVKKINKIIFITNSNSHNFFHWFLDVFQKLELINQNKEFILKNDIKIVIPHIYSDYYVKKSLEVYDLDFYLQKKNELILMKESIFIPNLAPTGNYRKKLVLKLSDRLRNYWIDKINYNKNFERIYVTRKNSYKRKLLNEDKIISILLEHKFKIVDFDKLSFLEQLSYALNTKILASIHGAALTHMLWIKPKSKVLEIRSRNNSHDNCYYSLASDLGHDYYYFKADKANIGISDHYSDLKIDEDYFSSRLKKILSARY